MSQAQALRRLDEYPFVGRVVVRPSRTEDRKYELVTGHARYLDDSAHRQSSHKPASSGLAFRSVKP